MFVIGLEKVLAHNGKSEKKGEERPGRTDVMARVVHECSTSAILISVPSFTLPRTGQLSSRHLLLRTSKCLLSSLLVDTLKPYQLWPFHSINTLLKCIKKRRFFMSVLCKTHKTSARTVSIQGVLRLT